MAKPSRIGIGPLANTTIAGSGGKRTEDLPPGIAALREVTLELAGNIELVHEAGNIGGSRKVPKVKDEYRTDSHDNPRAIVRARFFAQRRKDKSHGDDNGQADTEVDLPQPIRDEAVKARWQAGAAVEHLDI